jgi:hypothetical protein
MAGGSGADSMLHFYLKMGGNETKLCRKMKQMQRAHFGSMRRKCDTCGGLATSVGGRVPPERGKEGDDVSWSGVNLIRPKNEENPRDRFNYYKWMVKI